MRQYTAPESGSFNPRILLAFLLASAGFLLAMAGIASTPPTGTLTDTSGPITYSAGPFRQSNPSPLGLGQLDSGPRCNGQFPCDSYSLTVTLPTGYAAAHPNGALKATMTWVDAGTGNSDYDLYIFDGDVGNTNGARMAEYQSASGANPEIATISPLRDGTQKYTFKIVPYTASGETVQVKIELLPGTAGGGGGGGGSTGPFGGPDATAPGKARYQVFVAPAGSSAEPNSGEYNIGFNPRTGRIMMMNAGPIWRLTPPEVRTPAQPECCEGLWEDKSSTVTDVGLDPILFTDQKSGRTFASNSTAGANAVYAYTDNDGDLYMPIGAAPPNGGADHQTIGSGPYPNIPPFNLPGGLGDPANSATQGHAVYYCSQDVVGPAFCARSDTLGSTYGAGTAAYTGQSTIGCGGLHGHLHVAPDGTAWLPVNQCNGSQGGSFSIDGGITWTEFAVPGAKSQRNGADPSIAIDDDNTVYYAYVNEETVTAGNPPEGHPRVRVGTRNPVTNAITWTHNVDLGAFHGIKNAAHIEAIGGSPGRAAVGFFGTNLPGDYQALNFAGKWYAFVAITYDGGATWTTVNATPNDPVQSMTGIWQQGGGAQQRNTLDFNEITVDDKGRVLYGYSDGCVTAGCIAGTAPNDFVAHMRVARQIGGKTIYASYDSMTDTTVALAPKPACLSGTRTPAASQLSWIAPDNRGADITNYQIFRGTSPGSEVLIGQTGSNKTLYTDTTADPNVATYYYYVKAINSVGTGNPSNEIPLVVVPPPPIENVCALPGRTILTDPAGDNAPPSPGSDLRKFQISQPYSTDGVLRLGFTITTDAPGQNPQPANTAWYVAVRIVNGASTTYKAVRMAYKGTNPTGPTFESYTPSSNTSGGTDGRFVTSGTERPAEPGSNYDVANGKITIIVKASDLGLSAGQTIAGFVSGSSATTDPGGLGGATALIDQMPDSLSFTGAYTIQPNSSCAPSGVSVASVGSRKTHGAAGPYDVDLPLDNTVGIECRNGGASGNHTLVFTFANPLTSVGGASVTGGTGTVSSASAGSNAREYLVNLTGVTDQQTITVSLTNVQDSIGGFSELISAKMGVLAGDTNKDRFVNAGDISQTKNQSGVPVSAANFRQDLNLDGAINSGDISLVKSKSGNALPAEPAPTAAREPASVSGRSGR